MRRPVATFLLLPAVALTACGSRTIDQGRAESFLAGSIQPAPRAVKCPSGVPAKRGRSFVCSVVGADRRRYVVTVRIADDAGHPQVGAIHPR